MNRPLLASCRVNAAILVACASRPQMFTTLVPRPMDEVGARQQPGQDERLTADDVGHPQRPVAQLLDPGAERERILDAE